MNAVRIRTLGLALFAICLSVTLAVADDGDEQKGKGKGKGKGKSEIVEVDLSKLHPGIAQYIRDHLAASPAKGEKKGKGDNNNNNNDDKKKGKGNDEKKGKGNDEKKGKGKGMEISLSDAIRIAEKTGQGIAFKAERRTDADEPPFRVELRSDDGVKTKLSIDAAGKIVNTETKKKKG